MQIENLSLTELEVLALDVHERIKELKKAERKSNVKVYVYKGNVWTGRGRRPEWLEEYLVQGHKLDDILVHDGAKGA